MPINKQNTTRNYLSAIKPTEPSKVLELNDIVALKSHPYQTSYTEPKVGAYARFTPPVMIVIEVLNKTSHDTLTGIKDSNQYKCLFYSTTEGKFEKLWFKGEELKFIESYTKEDFNVSSLNINDWKKELVGKEVVLQTVDLELGKQKTFQDIIDGRSKMKVSTLLDYLPPVASIIDIKYEEGHIKHSEKNGKVTNSKLALQAKIKWLNNESGKFSEETIPLECLKFVEFNENEFLYKTKQTYILELKDRKKLESNESLFYKAYPFYLKSVTFKHYYYVYNSLNKFSKKSRVFLKKFPVTSILNLERLIDDGKDLGGFTDIQVYFADSEVFKSKWYHIAYLDRNSKYTERIVYVQDFSGLDGTDEYEDAQKKSLKCNCLLREGAIRNFRVEGIQKCIELPEEFEKIFFERV